MNRYGYCKSERAYLDWMRKALRKAWLKHPVRLEMLKENRKRILNKATNRMAMHLQCEHCNAWYPQSDIEINHKVAAGTLNLNTVGEHTNRLLNVFREDLERLCHECHAVVTYMERSGMNEGQAKVEKQVIAFFNKYNAAEQKERMKRGGLEPAKLEALRKLQVREKLREKAGIL